MNTDATLALIDGALEDDLSGDAMRWTYDDLPYEPVVLGPARLGGVRILTDRLGWDGYAATAAMRPYSIGHSDLQAVIDAYLAAVRALGELLRPVLEAYEAAGRAVLRCRKLAAADE